MNSGGNDPRGSGASFLEAGTAHQQINLKGLLDLTDMVSNDAKAQLKLLQEKSDAVSISDMFKMQMVMNRLSQMADMASAVVQSLNACMSSFSRGVRGN